MEIQDLKQEAELIDVPLQFDQEGNPVDGLKVVGADSDEYQAADRVWKVKSVRKTARRGRLIEASTETGAAELIDQVAKRELAICIACTKAIYGFTVGGKPAELTEENLTEIFRRKPTWRFKVLTAIEAEQPFIKASSAAGAQ